MSRKKGKAATLSVVLLVASLSVMGQTKSHLRYSGLFDTFYYRGPLSITAGPGIAVYSGDMCNTWACNKFKAGFGLGVVMPFFPRTSLGAEVRYFHLAANDIIPERNNTFRSRNIEAIAFAQVHILNQNAGAPNRKPRLLEPYVSIGLGVLQYNPVSFDANGQENPPEKSYPGLAPLVPVGVGTAFRITGHLGLAADLNYRYAFSDYLDDTSKLRGKNEKNDGYILLNVKVLFTPNPMGVDRKNPYK